jgi:hypothetical protein
MLIKNERDGRSNTNKELYISSHSFLLFSFFTILSSRPVIAKTEEMRLDDKVIKKKRKKKAREKKGREEKGREERRKGKKREDKGRQVKEIEDERRAETYYTGWWCKSNLESKNNEEW